MLLLVLATRHNDAAAANYGGGGQLARLEGWGGCLVVGCGNAVTDRPPEGRATGRAVAEAIHDVLLDRLEAVLEEVQVLLEGVQGLLGVAGRLVLADLIQELLPIILD